MEVTPNENDVLLGRGHFVNKYPGNQRFRDIVEEQKPNYIAAVKRKDKRNIAIGIINAIQSSNPPGRFLVDSKDSKISILSDGAWEVASPEKALQKVLHRLRENKAKGENEGMKFQGGREGEGLEETRLEQQDVRSSIVESVHPRVDMPTTVETKVNQGSLELLTSVSISWSTALQQRNSQLDYSSQIQQPEFSVAIERPNVESILDQKESASGIKCNIEPRSYGVTSICEHSEGTNPKANKISMKLHSGINELNNFGQAQQYLSIIGSGKHETFESQREKASFSREEWNSMPPLLGVAPMGGPSETRKPKAKDNGNNYWLMELHSKINKLGYNGPDQQQQNFLGSGNSVAKTILHGKATFPFDESNVHPQIVASKSIFPSGSLKTSVNDSDYVNFDSTKVETKAINQLYVNNDSQEFDHDEYSLRRWIDESKLGTKSDALDSADDRKRALSGYIASALLVASKITESLVKADKMEQSGCQNIVPLASIAAENIDLGLKNGRRSLTRSDQTKSPHQVLKRGDIQRNESRLNSLDNSQTNHLGAIDYVRMNCPPGNLSDVGNKTDRLFALGVVFVELFAFGNPTLDAYAINEIIASANAKSSGDTKMKPTFESTNNVPLKKRRSDQEQDSSSEISEKLALLGTPRPLCALVEDLLECIRGEFRRDDAYKSFEEVYLDLQLMITEPSKYLLDNHVPQLMISDKLYGRDEEMLKIQEAYKLRSTGDCLGVVITGEASVGKSQLARSIDELSWRNNGTVLEGKFDQIQESQPLSVIANIFNDMCQLFAESVRSQGMKQNVASALKSALGSQAGLLARFLPNLPRLMTLNSIQNMSSFCSESTQAIRLLFCKTLQVLSFYSPGPITILLDDVQWADPASLLLISSLLRSSKDNKSVFFIFCIRDNECHHSPDSTVNTWYQSTFEMPMKHITLANLSEDGVNAMVSDTLCLFPRLTRPLSRVLHRKTLGNPLFVWKTLKVLQKEGYLYHSLRGTMRRWMWDMDKIGELRLSENVLHLLIPHMNKLPSDLKMGLEVASCMGATVSMTVLGILSSHLKVDLVGILERVAKKGFMDRVGTEEYRFVHDRVQQEAYEMMTEHRRSERHTTFGLAIYSQACSNNDDDLLCISVNQINRAGPGTITDFRQKAMIAALNLKVGRRSTALKDFAYAYFCFKNGISFLNEEYWKHQYRLSIDLHDAAAAAACNLGSIGDVQKYSLSLLSHATSLEDKLNAMLAIVKSLRKSLALQEAKQWGVKFLQELGEEPCRIAGDPQLNSDISSMIKLIGDIADDSILNLKQSNDKKLVGIMKLYHEYFYIFQMVEPGMLFSVSHRMVQLSFERGLNEISPLAFAQFGVTALCMGNACEGYRMGSLALKLARNLGVPGLVSSIIAIVQPYVAWVSEPFRNIADSHQLGHTLGKQCGDESSSNLNNSWLELTNFLTGQDLTTISSEMHSIMREHREKHTWCTYCIAFTYYLSVALIEGPDFRDSVGASDIPHECDIIAFAKSRKYEIMSLNMQANQMIRSFLFRQYDEILKAPGILSRLLGNKIPLFSLFIVGVFYEGLASFCMARRLQDDIWITKGNAALAFIQHWSNLAPRNFENKVLLLEAEKYFTFGDSYKAQKCYEDAIRSAQTQQFIHEEAISHELVGLFYLDKGQHDNSRQSLSRSIGCFKLWGASAVAERLSSFIHANFETFNLEGDTK